MVYSHKPTKSSHAFDLLCCRIGKERWRRVIYNGVLYPDYDVSNMGRIRHWRRPREMVLSQTKDAVNKRASKPPFLGSYGKPMFGSKAKKDGVYLLFVLSNKTVSGQTKKRYSTTLVHRLIAEAFIPNDENKPTVDHWKNDDANKTNNRLDNLSFATYKEQAANQRPRTRESYATKKFRPVWKLDKTTGERLERYDSLAEAYKYVDNKNPTASGFSSNIRTAIKKKWTVYGFKWAYDDEDANAHEDETWKRIEPDVLDTKYAYDCSTCGRVRRVMKDGEKIIVNGADRSRGTAVFTFTLKNGQPRYILNNVLTAKVFIPNPHNLPQVNHKDGNPSNCHVSNLEWTTGSGNMQHAYANGLCKHVGWTPEEDRYILKLIAQCPEAKVGNGGIQWAKLNLILPGRSMNAMVTRASILRKRVGADTEAQAEAAIRERVEETKI